MKKPKLSAAMKPSDVLKKAIAKAKREKWEEMFRCQLIGSPVLGRLNGFPLCSSREWKFDPNRDWRLDFCWPSVMVAVEIEGLAAPWMKSRHTTNSGFSADCEKYNQAALLGWTVGRFTGQMVKSGAALAWTEAVLKGRIE